MVDTKWRKRREVWQGNCKIRKNEDKENQTSWWYNNQIGKKPELVGYRAFHNFRADDNVGNTSIGNIITFFDKDMTQLTYILEESEYEALQEYIKEEILPEE